MNRINVYSETQKLKKVLLHRPGREVENLTPNIMKRLLFDDIPYLVGAQKEHDNFAKVLRDTGTEVVYLVDLVTDVIKNEQVKREFLKQFLNEANIFERKEKLLTDYYLNYNDDKKLIEDLISGLRTEEFDVVDPKILSDIVDMDYPFIIDPMPNLYFARDPFASIGRGVSINKMDTVTRNRETIFASYIFKYHKDYNQGIPKYYEREYNYSIEGGDILVLNDEVIAIGISARTKPEAIENFANNVLNSDESFKSVLAFNIPKKRAFMHLDTVFTMIDKDIFTIHPEIEDPLKVYKLTSNNKKIEALEMEDTLENILKKELRLDEITLIRCGGNSSVDAQREQWNDGSNTLAIAPKEVIVYDRNTVTNKLLVEHGIKIHEIISSEIARGRGGPRCMSMPLIRE